MSDVREASLAPGSAPLPGGLYGQAGPFALLALGALWLHRQWSTLPARVPIHWNWRGDPDHFVARGPAVALPLILGAVICAVTLALQAGVRHASPRGPLRAPILKLVLASEYFVALLTCAAMAASVTGSLAPLFVAGALGIPALLVASVAIVRSVPRAPPRNPSAWHAFFYFDRDDPALLVPKKSGLGYTFNFGNPYAAPLMFAMLALPLLAAVFAVTAR